MIRGVLGWMFGRGAPTLVPPEPAQAPAPVVPTALAPEAWLAELVAALTEGRRVDEVASPEMWTHVDALVGDGRDRLAAEWLDKIIVAAPAQAAALRPRAVELRAQRGELAQAVPHLEVLARALDDDEDDAHARRAHLLLAEHEERRGDLARAQQHLEAVLAVDLDHPGVLARAEALRRRRGSPARPAAPGADDTVAGPGPGVTLGSRYRLVAELGRGATGAVYLARDTELERSVAVKLLHPHLATAAQAAARERFFAEARLAASLRHPNIIGILDVHPAERRLVMELAAGGTLRQRLAQGPLPVARALELHREILSALVAVHRRGVVHRDLNPANLLFRRPPDAPASEIVLTDFGVAHLSPVHPERRDREAGPESKGALGTLPFMAPEQRRGDEVTPAVDLYAAGVILFQMLSGRLPWDHETTLRGTRTDGDLAWPTLPSVSAHLLALSHPDPTRRPAAVDALEDARRLS